MKAKKSVYIISWTYVTNTMNFCSFVIIIATVTKNRHEMYGIVTTAVFRSKTLGIRTKTREYTQPMNEYNNIDRYSAGSHMLHVNNDLLLAREYLCTWGSNWLSMKYNVDSAVRDTYLRSTVSRKFESTRIGRNGLIAINAIRMLDSTRNIYELEFYQVLIISYYK